ncbi:Pentatricopeptide repeat-containing protein, chloroplastic [Glycine soja]
MQTRSKSHFLTFFTMKNSSLHSLPPSLFTTIVVANGDCTFPSQIPNPSSGFVLSWEPFLFGTLFCLKGEQLEPPLFPDLLFLHGAKAETQTKEKKLAVCNRYREAMKLFEILELEHDGFDVDGSTYDALVSACVGLRSIRGVKRVFNCMISRGFEPDLYLMNRVLFMHVKCGLMLDARKLFDEMPEKDMASRMTMIGGLVDYGNFSINNSGKHNTFDFYSKWGRMEDARHVFNWVRCKNVISWSALIAGYGNHGQGEEAVEMFEQMLQEGMIPNHVDREGLLDEAYEPIRSAPFKPTTNMSAALLTACRMHYNLELGKVAAENLYGMEPEKLCNYIVLLNLYNSSGKLKEAAGVLQTLKRKGLRMLPACTWIEVKKQPHAFLCGDKSHSQRKEIYEKVDNLMVEISRHGYVEENETLLPDVDEEEQRILKYHSEKLDIAFGLINTPHWTPLQITQGHRVCGDCHSAIKLIAMVTRREIVVRDASKFHHFRNGSCSCSDYWCDKVSFKLQSFILSSLLLTHLSLTFD